MDRWWWWVAGIGSWWIAGGGGSLVLVAGRSPMVDCRRWVATGKVLVVGVLVVVLQLFGHYY